MKNFLIIVVAVFGVGSQSFASGFSCADNSGNRVKIYNHLSPEDGTRLPAIFVLSKKNIGTVLVAKGEQISKRNHTRVVQYAVRGNALVGVDYVVVQIQFKEGRQVLAKGASVPGSLVLAQRDGRKSVTTLRCQRYTKH